MYVTESVLSFRRAAQYAEIELLAVGRQVDFYLVALRKLGKQNLLGERILDELLDRSLERTRSELLVVAVFHKERRRRFSELESELLVAQSLLNILEQNLDDRRDVFLRQRMEDDDIVEPVEELRIERVLHLFLHLLGD